MYALKVCYVFDRVAAIYQDVCSTCTCMSCVSQQLDKLYALASIQQFGEDKQLKEVPMCYPIALR